MPLHDQPTVFSKLAKMPESTEVRVVVRGEGSASQTVSSAISPRAFKSAAEYRAELIRLQKKNSQGIKAAVVAQARQMGLKAEPAASLNAVTVQGYPRQILELLQLMDLTTAVLESPLKLTPLPRAR